MGTDQLITMSNPNITGDLGMISFSCTISGGRLYTRLSKPVKYNLHIKFNIIYMHAHVAIHCHFILVCEYCMYLFKGVFCIIGVCANFWCLGKCCNQ